MKLAGEPAGFMPAFLLFTDQDGKKRMCFEPLARIVHPDDRAVFVDGTH
ncbi:MAG TPA: hypothetical protein PLQ89_20855 [Phycisphaerae bacterium]|nr:hypothetical protein [Phycisphaerae bacterium]